MDFLDLLWKDTADFTYTKAFCHFTFQPEFGEQPCEALVREKESSIYTYKPLCSSEQRKQWLINVPKIEEKHAGSVSILFCARQQPPASITNQDGEAAHNRHVLEHLPFPVETFQDVVAKLYIHEAFAKLTARPTSTFWKADSAVGDKKCIVYILCVDSILVNHTAICLTYFPDTKQLFGIFLGCEAQDIRQIKSRIGRGPHLMSNPFLYLAIFIEIEKKHRFEDVDKRVDDLEIKMKGLDKPSLFSPRSLLSEQDPGNLVKLYLKLSRLKVELTTWNAQLKNMQGCTEYLSTLISDQTARSVFNPGDYLSRTMDAFNEKILRCETVMEGTSLAFQAELADVARKDARISIRDGKQMKAIALLTMFFLPATFIATFMDAPIYSWDGRGHWFWIISAPVTAAVVMAYFAWTLWYNPRMTTSKTGI